ncbi:hypothetical protein TM239_01490 [Bradyrhizobium sp. TM239]|nr:hypothetical protein TM239_01490 [Bradyrhizobium sp. TM239]
MLGPRAAFGKNDRDVARGLTDARHEAIGKTFLSVPADHAASDDDSPFRGHAIGITFWVSASGLQNPCSLIDAQ